MGEIKLFPCYSVPMRNFFDIKGIKYKLVGLNPKTKKMFWVYIKDYEFQKALDEWSINKLNICK